MSDLLAAVVLSLLARLFYCELTQPTNSISISKKRWWARRKGAFAHPTEIQLEFRICSGVSPGEP
jgi:hypothetical protein